VHRASLRIFDTGVGGGAEEHLAAALGSHREGLRPAAAGADGGDFLEGLDLGAILGAGAAPGPRDQDQPLAAEAEAVVAVEMHTAGEAVLRNGSGASGDGGDAGELATETQQAVRAAARIDDGKLGREALDARRHHNVGRKRGLAVRRGFERAVCGADDRVPIRGTRELRQDQSNETCQVPNPAYGSCSPPIPHIPSSRSVRLLVFGLRTFLPCTA
jgi:hypothetical protein